MILLAGSPLSGASDLCLRESLSKMKLGNGWRMPGEWLAGMMGQWATGACVDRAFK